MSAVAVPVAPFGRPRQIGAPNLGYSVIMTLAVVYFALGTYFVHKIRGVR